MTFRQGCTFLLLVSALLTATAARTGSLIDPTRPVTTPKATTGIRSVIPHSGWTLESTLVATNRRIAMINGKLVSEGDSVDGARVLKINKTDVVMQTADQRITLQLVPDMIMREP